jgi:hypothetical protein
MAYGYLTPDRQRLTVLACQFALLDIICELACCHMVTRQRPVHAAAGQLVGGVQLCKLGRQALWRSGHRK